MTDMLLYITDLPDAKWEDTNRLCYWTFLLVTKSSLSASEQCHCKYTIVEEFGEEKISFWSTEKSPLGFTLGKKQGLASHTENLQFVWF